MSIQSDKLHKLVWSRPLVMELNWDDILAELGNMQEDISDVRWISEDDDVLFQAFDGNEENAWEFKMAFYIVREGA